jgi:hypothetical protein
MRKDSYVSDAVKFSYSTISAIKVTAGGGRSATVWQDGVTAECHGPKNNYYREITTGATLLFFRSEKKQSG